jgi:uncharacterized protein YwqG
MFESKSDIRAALAEAELAPFAAAVERLCTPAICFLDASATADAAARPASSRLAGSRLGGAPDLPSDQAWPVRAAYSNGKTVEDRLAARRPWARNLFTAPAPLYFIAQIDLAAVARTGVLPKRLPDHGRLLFFWDPKCGPWIDSAQSCRVLWDRSPLPLLTPRDAPAELGVPDASFDLPSLFPMRPIAFLGIWSVPARFLLQDLARRANEDELLASLEDEDWEDEWQAFWDNAGHRSLTSGREVALHRLGGWPVPEQDDPRVTAAASAYGAELFGRVLTPAERQESVARMHDWTLLLQVDLHNLTRAFAEGMVYFVMRAADLASGNFDRVHAIYQQT